MNTLKFYSDCCGALMPRWPDEDFYPQCKEHTLGIMDYEEDANRSEKDRHPERNNP